MTRAGAKVLLVGVGGIGCPAAMALARAGVGTLGLCDDDVVERSNLHRQILFHDSDVGFPKVMAAARRLGSIVPHLNVELHEHRLLPDNAVNVVRGYDLVLEGADNFATKFLAADACRLAGVPVVHASAVRWVGTAMAVGPEGSPCYRCLFEDVPHDGAPSCAEAGVMGPVVGLVAAAQVDLALGWLDGAAVFGELVTVDGRLETIRRRRVARRADCSLCGAGARIRRIDAEAYTSPACAG
ncbi:MAG: HesA/MoeB/ThiF family protein [Polyangiaceae bacterium]|nr:HesA/MoeB/ThiF family protein [Polyangiaceae bacterium]